MGKHFFGVLAIIFLILMLLIPLITYSYLTNSYELAIDSYTNKEKELQQQVDSLAEQNKRLIEENSQLTNLTKPYLISRLGWYLHKSNDPVISSRNKFTIYGTIYNIGRQPANNADLTVRFFGNNGTLLQTSKITLGIVSSMINSTQPFDTPFDIGRQNIDCSIADSVIDIDVSLHYQ